MIGNAIKYVFARGGPAAINFLTLAVLTRILAPADFGRYALVVAWVGLVSAVLHQWLNSGARRYLAAYQEGRTAFLASLLRSFLVIAAVEACVVLALFLWIQDPAVRAVIVAGLVLLWAQSWHELNLELTLADLAPGRYARRAIAKALLALGISVLLIRLGWGAYGAILGAAVGFLLPVLPATFTQWREARQEEYSVEAVRHLALYGVPLVGTFVFQYIVNFSDRFFLNFFHGTSAVGGYSAAYDLTQQTLIMLMVIANMAAFPMVVRAIERGDTVGSKDLLRTYAVLLLGVALPATIGLVLLAGPVAHVAFGPNFAADAARFIPPVAVAILLAGFKAHFLDLSFQLGKSTGRQSLITGVAAIINAVLNVIWIPRFGGLGAAYATIVAFAVGGGLSWYDGRRVFPLVFPLREWAKIVAATAVMAAVVWPFRTHGGPLALAGAAMLGICVYAIAVVGLDVHGLRAKVLGFALRHE